MSSPSSYYPEHDSIVASDHIPTELWARIFDYLPRDALMHVDLTHRLFAHIARPLLFRDFEFRPYSLIPGVNVVGAPPSAIALPAAEQVDLLLQRLEFWTSANIALCVRSCHVTLRPLPPPPNAHGWRFSHHLDNPYILLTALFNSLPHFANLHHLFLREVHVTQIGMQSLCLLARLQILEVDLCSGDTIDSSKLIPPRISHFRFRHDITVITGVDHWIPFLRVNTLRHLDITYHERLWNRLGAFESFPSVTSLIISANGRTIPRALEVLFKFLATQVLTFEAWGPVFDDDFRPRVPISQRLTSLAEYSSCICSCRSPPCDASFSPSAVNLESCWFNYS
ncbi:hypothetical protein FB451DRAFT_791514 [Mycena latifolia]|nr:hypothetical protein FB451DRAFT_791514 [Mycena latifolia]